MKRYGDKLLIQAVICLTLFAAVRMSAVLDGEITGEIKDYIKVQFEKNYTIEDIRKAGDMLAGKIRETPATIASVITRANEAGEFGTPINKNDKDTIKTVHAVGDGEIIYAGIEKDMGVCIKISHGEKTSVYGNLYTLTAVTGEKVKKGDVIGTFDKNGEKEFYYQLKDSVV